MAIRTKTLQYWLGQTTQSVASASVYVHPVSTTLYIAETGSRIIRNAFAEIYWRDVTSVTTNRGNVATQSLFLKLGNNAYTTASIIAQMTDTAEHVCYIGAVDLTDYFSSSFSTNNISQSCNWQFQYFIEQPATRSYDIRGLATLLYITYNYDDSNTPIRSKTAIIPLAYTSSFNAVTFRQLDIIPALDTYCTESNKTFDQIWLEMEGANGHTAATNYSMLFFIDEGPKTASFEILNPTNINTWTKYYFPLSNINTSTTHSFNASPSITTVAAQSNMLTVKATYRYDHDNSNYILNTPEYILENSNMVSVPFTSDKDAIDGTYGFINIQEPDPIIQKNCAVKIYTSINAALQLRISPKEGNSHLWTLPQGSTEGSSHVGQLRFDPEKASPFTGSAGLIQRGDNFFVFAYSSTNAQRIASVVTTIVLNYISGKDPRGDGVHSHTVIASAITGSNGILTPYDGTNNQYGRSLMLDSPIRDADYYINSHIIESIVNASIGTLGNVNQWFNSLENVGADNISPTGSIREARIIMEGDNENSVARMSFNYNNYFTKYPAAIVRRNPLQTDIIRYYRDQALRCCPRQITTYHGISYTVTGSITGYTGDGSGIIVECIESGSSNTNAGKIFQTVTDVGGVFSGSVYDNTKQYFVTARQSATLTSRSDDATGSVIIV
jgi:hypothetical protein